MASDSSACIPQQVAIVEFEVNQMGYWSPGTKERRTVRAIFELLTSAGYECFWEQDDALLPASGQCFDAQLDTARNLKWSNVVCAHEHEVIGVLDAMAQEAYRNRIAKAARGTWLITGPSVSAPMRQKTPLYITARAVRAPLA
jgi:hypothetical protein